MKKFVKIIVSLMLILSLIFPTAAVIDNYYGNENPLDEMPPYVPSNPNPENYEEMVLLDTNLSFDGGSPEVGDILYYSIYFGSSYNPTFVDTIGPYEYDQIEISWDPEEKGIILDYETEYYWYIVVTDDDASYSVGNVWRFTTIPLSNPPIVPNSPIPLNNSVYVSINTNLEWKGGDLDIDDLVYYMIYFGTEQDPPYVATVGPFPYDQYLITISNPGILEYETQYYWKITSYDGEGQYSYGPVWNFITELVPNEPPYIPSDPNPINGSIDVGVDVILSWSGGDPDSGDQVYYDIYFGIESQPPFVETVGPYPAEQTIISWDPPGMLDYETYYYWQIMPYDEQVCTLPGPIWEFQTEEANNPPYEPSNPNPEDGIENVSTDATLSWTGGDPDGDDVFYDVYFGTDIINMSKVSSNQSQDTYIPGILEYNTQYYWKIVSWDEYEESTEGPIWTFITEDQGNSPPMIPQITKGPHAAAPGINLTFTTYSSDPEEEQIYYNFSWGDGNNTGWLGPYNSSENVTVLYTYLMDGNYQIKVKAKDILDQESDWSEPYNITISNQIEFSNLEKGFVYFRLGYFEESYAYIYLLDELGFTVVLGTSELAVALEGTESVDNVNITSVDLIFGDNISIVDEDSTDGFSANFSIPTGLWQVTANAYDIDGNLIDTKIIEYLVYLNRGTSVEQKITQVSKIRQSIRNKLLKN